MSIRTLKYADIAVGDELPAHALPITTSLIVCGALATRDFEPLHHDKAVAQAIGISDVFMNILTSQGLMETYVTDWSGPDTVIRKLALRLGAPNLPGDTMTITGTVSAKAGGIVDVEVTGQNERFGTHMTGVVSIALPQ
jgi:acyl dehydratase